MESILEAIADAIKTATHSASGLGGFALLIALGILVEGVARIFVAFFKAIGNISRTVGGNKRPD